jgi:hypothetical protein
MLAGVAALMCVGTGMVLAQPNDGGGRRGDRGSFDPAQFQQRMMERYKEVLEVKDDAEWNVIQPLVQKVMDVRRDQFGGMMGRGMFGRGPGGDRGGDRGPRPGFGTPNPEVEALQRAVDGKASNADMKAAIAKLQESRKAKQAELESAQAALRKVLSVRQEAIATLNGLL